MTTDELRHEMLALTGVVRDLAFEVRKLLQIVEAISYQLPEDKQLEVAKVINRLS